jgi:hypothetical protein
MAITTLDGYIGAAKQKLRYVKTASATSVAAQWHTLWNLAGDPGAGSFGQVIAANSSTAGTVCDYTMNGFPTIRPFGAGNTGYMTTFDYSDSVAGRFMIYDRVWQAGPFDCSTTRNPSRTYSLTVNPSLYEYRVPLQTDGKRDWSVLELWAEVSTAFTAQAATLSVGYMNKDASIGCFTIPTGSLSGFITGRAFNLSLAAGDNGIIKVTDVSIGGALLSGGVFNLFLARPLYVNARVNVANYSDVHGFEKLGFPIIEASSAIALMYAADSTATGIVDCMIGLCNG